jgi:hypothetical protein
VVLSWFHLPAFHSDSDAVLPCLNTSELSLGLHRAVVTATFDAGSWMANRTACNSGMHWFLMISVLPSILFFLKLVEGLPMVSVMVFFLYSRGVLERVRY